MNLTAITEQDLLKAYDREAAGIPIGRPAEVNLRNNHTQYIFTWYVKPVGYLCVPKDMFSCAERPKIHQNSAHQVIQVRSVRRNSNHVLAGSEKATIRDHSQSPPKQRVVVSGYHSTSSSPSPSTIAGSRTLALRWLALDFGICTSWSNSPGRYFEAKEKAVDLMDICVCLIGISAFTSGWRRINWQCAKVAYLLMAVMISFSSIFFLPACLAYMTKSPQSCSRN